MIMPGSLSILRLYLLPQFGRVIRSGAVGADCIEELFLDHIVTPLSCSWAGLCMLLMVNS